MTTTTTSGCGRGSGGIWRHGGGVEAQGARRGSRTPPQALYTHTYAATSLSALRVATLRPLRLAARRARDTTAAERRAPERHPLTAPAPHRRNPTAPRQYANARCARHGLGARAHGRTDVRERERTSCAPRPGPAHAADHAGARRGVCHPDEHLFRSARPRDLGIHRLAVLAALPSCCAPLPRRSPARSALTLLARCGAGGHGHRHAHVMRPLCSVPHPARHANSPAASRQCAPQAALRVWEPTGHGSSAMGHGHGPRAFNAWRPTTGRLWSPTAAPLATAGTLPPAPGRRSWCTAPIPAPCHQARSGLQTREPADLAHSRSGPCGRQAPSFQRRSGNTRVGQR